jgi:hypothetical protein
MIGSNIINLSDWTYKACDVIVNFSLVRTSICVCRVTMIGHCLWIGWLILERLATTRPFYALPGLKV